MSIKQFDLIIVLSAAEHVLSNTIVSSTMLQGNSVDLIEAAQGARAVANIMKTERSDPSVWKTVCERGKQIAAEFEIRPCMPRTTGRQQTQGECLSSKPRVLLAKSCVPPTY